MIKHNNKTYDKDIIILCLIHSLDNFYEKPSFIYGLSIFMDEFLHCNSILYFHLFDKDSIIIDQYGNITFNYDGDRFSWVLQDKIYNKFLRLEKLKKLKNGN
jgi:hypothetical protein